MAATPSTTITRHYIDTRPLSSLHQSPQALPLIETLQLRDQKSITTFIRHPDRLMSLASQLLKYHFIHRTAKIPWSEVVISRWPPPHKRPYWEPPDHWTEDYGVEFNVSHQAGMVALLGCRTPYRTSADDQKPDAMVSSLFTASDPANHPTSPRRPPNPRLGVDITCTNEPRRTPTHIKTEAELSKWIDIFSEMFSDRERDDMKHHPIHSPFSSSLQCTTPLHFSSTTDPADEISLKLRRFYTYWSLKEAFIKMVGEGLLAPWLRELEFIDIRAPPSPFTTSSSLTTTTTIIRNGPAEENFKIFLRNREVPRDRVAMEVVSYGSDFLFATAIKGLREEDEDEDADFLSTPLFETLSHTGVGSEDGGRILMTRRWIQLDIDRDIRPCAEGRCACLAS